MPLESGKALASTHAQCTLLVMQILLGFVVAKSATLPVPLYVPHYIPNGSHLRSLLQGGNPAKVAVASLSLAIERGEVFGLLGPNGAGKTSAINMMIGFLEPTSGVPVLSRIIGRFADLVSMTGV